MLIPFRVRLCAALCGLMLSAPLAAGAGETVPLAPGPPRAGVPVFTYHMVDRRIPPDHIGNALTITPQQFAAQLATLAMRHLRTISASDLVGDLRHGVAPPHTVVLTFDDGYKDSVTEALPLLRHYHDTATFYIISGTIGTPRHLTWSDVRALRAAGMEIGAHGRQHVDLRELNEPGQLAQVSGCVHSLERWARIDPQTYAYPSGRYNATTFDVMRREHVEAAFTMEPGFVHNLANPYRLPRIRVMRVGAVANFRAIADTL